MNKTAENSGGGLVNGLVAGLRESLFSRLPAKISEDRYRLPASVSFFRSGEVVPEESEELERMVHKLASYYYFGNITLEQTLLHVSAVMGADVQLGESQIEKMLVAEWEAPMLMITKQRKNIYRQVAINFRFKGGVRGVSGYGLSVVGLAGVEGSGMGDGAKYRSWYKYLEEPILEGVIKEHLGNVLNKPLEELESFEFFMRDGELESSIKVIENK